uniref:Uncharacterized protein n=1 Tax=Acrobeloides nanus TaxID=290746 RepID=A0A914DA94_9BILA
MTSENHEEDSALEDDKLIEILRKIMECSSKCKPDDEKEVAEKLENSREDLIEMAKEIRENNDSIYQEDGLDQEDGLEQVENLDNDVEAFDFPQFRKETAEADKACSAYAHPDLLFALEEAGKYFEKTGTKYLNKQDKYYIEEVKSIKDANNFAKMVVDGLSMLTCPDLKIILDPNSIQLALVGCIQMAYNKSMQKLEDNVTFAKAITGNTKKDKVGWVEYEFHSEQLIKAFLIFKKRRVSLNVKTRYFIFPNEKDFRHALRRAEKKVKAEEAEKKVKADEAEKKVKAEEVDSEA